MAEYTELPGNRRYKKINFLDAGIPQCNHHHISGGTPCPNKGDFDTPTKYGPWADLCADHIPDHVFRDVTYGFHRIPNYKEGS